MQTFLFGRAMLLLDSTGHRLFVYNEVARAIWEALSQGASVETIASDFATASGEAPSAVADQVRSLIEEWRVNGLNGCQDRAGEAHISPSWADVPTPDWSSQWTCAIGEQRFRFSVEHPRGAAFIRNVLGHFDAEDGAVDGYYEVRDTGPFEAAVIEDGREVVRTGNSGLIVGAIYQSLLKRIHPETEWRALIHGGATALGGRGIGFPAPSGSGKTTLIASLVASGFDYLSDDLLAISASGNRIVPWPVPLSIKSGSWPVLEKRYPELASAPVYKTKGLSARLLVPSADAWSRPSAPLAALIFPTFVPGATTLLSRIEPFDALVRLLNDRVWIGYPLTESRVKSFLDWLQAVPVFTLRHSNLAEASIAIKELLDK